jgi:hypothetical protein
MTTVKIISRQGQSALVEFTKNDRLQRATVPVEDIVDSQISDYKLKLGIPYGIEWSKYIKLEATPQDLEQNLRRAGIWTKQDALTNAQRVLGAIQKTYQVDLGTLLRIAKEAK